MAAAEEHLSFGREEMKQGNLQKAYSHYQTALMIEPGCAEAFVMISQLHYKEGDLDGAIAKLEEATADDSQQRDLIYNNLGLLYAKKGRYREAVEMFHRSLDSGMQTSVIYKNIGNVFLSLGQYDRAITAYSKAVDFRPDINTIYSDMLREAAKNYYGDEEHEAQYDAAVDHLERGVSDEDLLAYDREIVELYVSKTPKSADNFFNLGRAYHLNRDLGNAIANYIEALKIDPRSDRVRKSLSSAYSQTGDVEKASALMRGESVVLE